MKKHIVSFLVLLILAAEPLLAAQISVSAPIQEVTVYRGKALILRNGKFSAKVGDHQLVLSNLSPYMDVSTLRVRSDKSFQVTDVAYNKNYQLPLEKNTKLEALQNKIELTENTIEDLNSQISLNAEQIAFLKANQTLSGKEQNVKLVELKEMNDYFASSMRALRQKQLELSRNKKKESETLDALRRELEQMQQNKNTPAGELTLNIESFSEGNKELEISYITDGATWQLSYDAHTNSQNNTLRISYKAVIQQNTGVDWNQVRLKLSTASAADYSVLPQMQTYFLDFAPPPQVYFDGYRRKGMPMARDMALAKEEGAWEKSEALVAAAPAMQEQEKMNAIEYSVDKPRTIVSQQKESRALLKIESIPVTYKYKTLPAYSPRVFLIASLPQTTALQLPAGEMNLFVENTFSGKTYFNPAQFDEQIEISMGIDSQVAVKREKIQDYSKTQTIGNQKRITRGWKISLKNLKGKEIDVEIADQIPVSNQKEISVEAEEISGAKLNSESGELIWQTKLLPAQNKDLILRYQVKFPKDKKVDLP